MAEGDTMAGSQERKPSGEKFLQLIEAHETRNPDIISVRHTAIKKGPGTFKRAAVLRVASHGAGRPEHDKLSLEAYDYTAGGGFDFEHPKYKWHCEGDEEIERLRVFLEKYVDVSEPGRYAVVPVSEVTAVDMATVAEFLLTNDVDASDIAKLIEGLLVHSDEFSALPSLGEEDQRRMLAAALRAAHRSDALRKLAQLVEEGALETPLQSLLVRNWWLLGGQYVGMIERRHWTERDTVDMLLQTADGYFDVIELKRSTPPVCKRDHDMFSMTAEVNDAVNQAANYIAVIERRRDTLLADHHIDLYKLKAKVIIGRIRDDDPHRDAKRTAIRTYNSHLHRIEVITYDELLRFGQHVVSANRGESRWAGTADSD